MMSYIEMAGLLLIAIYPLSYAKYNWNQNNKLGAAGVILLITLQLMVPIVILIMR